MGRPRLCNPCCTEPPPPDCFGCTDTGLWFPSVWQLDMPSAITTIISRGCGPTTASTGLTTRRTIEGYVEYPEIPTTSLLIVDDRPINSYSFDWVTCIWMSNDFKMYEKVTAQSLSIATVGCTHGGHAPWLSRSADWLGPTPWYYYENPAVSLSPNRTRVHLSTDHTPDALCGTEVDPAIPSLSPNYSCNYAPFGCQWVLSIETVSYTHLTLPTNREV